MTIPLPDSRPPRPVTTDSGSPLPPAQTDARYRLLFDAVDQGFCVAEAIFDSAGEPVDYRIEDVNYAYETMTGFVDSRGKYRTSFSPPPEKIWLESIARVALTGEPARYERYSPSWNRWFSIYILRLGDSSSRLVGMLITDYTARKLIEERAEFLSSLSQRLAPANTEEEIVTLATTAVGEHLKADRCYFVECREATGEIIVGSNWTRPGTSGIAGRFKLFDFGGIEWWRQYSSGDFSVDDVTTHPLTAGKSANYHAIGVRSYAVQPFRTEGDRTVVLGVTDSKPRVWTREELTLIDEVTARVWPLVEQARADRAARVALEEHARALERTVAELHAARSQAAASERTTAESEERLRVLSEVVTLQVWTAGTDGGLDFANQECANYFGADIERDILGNSWAQFVHADDVTRAVKQWQQSLSTGEPYEIEFRLRHKSGEYRWFIVRAQAMRDPAGRITKWFGTNTEIDEIKRAQSVVERANRAKDEFLAALSHELRTPLAPVLMATSALLEDDRLPPDVKEQIGMMERNITLEARLIDDLLDLTRISHGKLQLRAQPCDAHSLIGLALEIVREEARFKNISIDQKLTAKRSGLVADPARFQQVIWNLLRNAVKFTPHGGHIIVRTSETDAALGAPRLRIEVTDNGIGIDPAKLAQIFLPFEQGEVTGKHRFGGLGLGLAIARAIVDLHNGAIRAHSAGKGQGATFTVEFPDVQLPPTGVARPGAGHSKSLHPTPPLRLLVVEDHANTLHTLTKLLNRDGHSVTAATSLGAALAAAAGQTFDLVISDLGLPDGTGTELMEKLHAAYGLRGIALSGYGMEEDLVRSRQAGFVAHLVKPVHISELRRVLSLNLPKPG